MSLEETKTGKITKEQNYGEEDPDEVAVDEAEEIIHTPIYTPQQSRRLRIPTRQVFPS